MTRWCGLSTFRSATGINSSNTYSSDTMVMQDTDLDIPRTDRFVLVEVVSRPRTSEQKQAFNAHLTEDLFEKCGVLPSDLMVSLVETSDADWSFGFGRAQFLTKELQVTSLREMEPHFPPPDPGAVAPGFFFIQRPIQLLLGSLWAATGRLLARGVAIADAAGHTRQPIRRHSCNVVIQRGHALNGEASKR